MEIVTLSGATSTQLHDKELGCMVESGRLFGDLKKLLSSWPVGLDTQDFDKDS